MYVLSIVDEFEVENRDFIPVFCLFIISFCSIVALALCRTKYADVREINDFCSKSGNLWGYLIKNTTKFRFFTLFICVFNETPPLVIGEDLLFLFKVLGNLFEELANG